MKIDLLLCLVVAQIGDGIVRPIHTDHPVVLKRHHLDTDTRPSISEIDCCHSLQPWGGAERDVPRAWLTPSSSLIMSPGSGKREEYEF